MIKTTESDEVFYARREGKSGYSRFVRNRTPHSTNVFTMIIERRDRMAQIIAAYHGYRSHPEPYDSKATKEAIVYWRNHALIPHPIFKIDYTVCKEVSPGRIRIKTSPDRGVAFKWIGIDRIKRSFPIETEKELLNLIGVLRYCFFEHSLDIRPLLPLIEFEVPIEFRPQFIRFNREMQKFELQFKTIVSPEEYVTSISVLKKSTQTKKQNVPARNKRKNQFVKIIYTPLGGKV